MEDKQSSETKERVEWHELWYSENLPKSLNICIKVHKSISKVNYKHVNARIKWANRYSTEVVVNINGSMQILNNNQAGSQKQLSPHQHEWFCNL